VVPLGDVPVVAGLADQAVGLEVEQDAAGEGGRLAVVASGEQRPELDYCVDAVDQRRAEADLVGRFVGEGATAAPPGVRVCG
jgi:hypothetical protein